MVQAAGRRRGFKSWFVEPYKQVKLGLMFLLVNIFFSIMIALVFGYYVWDMYLAVSTYFQLNQQESVLTFSKFNWPIYVGLGLVVLFMVTTILVSVRYTHDIYGPLVSINRLLDDLLANRRPNAIMLRESDQLQDLARKLNLVAERLVDDQRAGPMVAIHRFIDDLLAGKKPTPLQLRDGDLYADLAGKLNRLAEKIKV
jgi:hypothetical protein